MLSFLAIISLAAAAVTAFNRLRRRDPAAADVLARTVTDAMTLVLIIGQAAMSALETLRRSTRRAVVSEPHEYAMADFDD
jgi:hypothetical protein